MKIISSIENNGIEKVYDLKVKSNSNFITRAAILHNCDFRGSVKIKLTSDHPKNTMRVEKGDRIGQGILMAAPRVAFRVVDELGSTERGEGGFGSTGQ